jgi:hypothetical protein
MLATAVPVGLAAWWLIIGFAALWRRSVWREAGADVRALAERWSVPVRTSFTGYRVVGAAGSVRWSGGIDGSVTVVRGGRRRRRIDGWLGVDEAEAALRALGAAEAPDAG